MADTEKTTKLYPPVIYSTLPPFYHNDDNELVITVPFNNNRSVSRNNISDMILRIKTIQTDYVNLDFAFIGDNIGDVEGLNKAYENGTITFKIPRTVWQVSPQQWIVNIGQYYKIQLAYVDTNGNDGYFSSVGISKFTFYPDVYIEGLDPSSTNNHNYTYVGRYSQFYQGQVMDITEKVFYYKFVITNNSNVLKDTGWVLHNSETDTNEEYTSYDIFEYLGELPSTGTNRIQYSVQTNSGLVVDGPSYKIASIPMSESSEIKCTCSLNEENGYVKVVASGTISADKFYIVRNIAGDNSSRYKIAEFNSLAKATYLDLTVEQGIEYEYRVYAKVNNQYKYSAPANMLVDYQHIYIFDGKKQLKVKYNPSVSSYSEVIMESKVDTIGGKYPVLLRNGDTRYTNFTVGGWVSFVSDEEGLFDKGYEIKQYTRTSTDSNEEVENQSFSSQNASNFKRERDFRTSVIEWLNNGKEKLYRSPTEGLKMVRLTNVSFNPEPSVARMVYSFNATVVEIDGHDYEELIKYNIYEIKG